MGEMHTHSSKHNIYASLQMGLRQAQLCFFVGPIVPSGPRSYLREAGVLTLSTQSPVQLKSPLPTPQAKDLELSIQ